MGFPSQFRTSSVLPVRNDQATENVYDETRSISASGDALWSLLADAQTIASNHVDIDSVDDFTRTFRKIIVGSVVAHKVASGGSQLMLGTPGVNYKIANG